jgi:hypothetical protein
LKPFDFKDIDRSERFACEQGVARSSSQDVFLRRNIITNPNVISPIDDGSGTAETAIRKPPELSA